MIKELEKTIIEFKSGIWYVLFNKQLEIIKMHESSFIDNEKELNDIIKEKRLIAIIKNICANRLEEWKDIEDYEGYYKVSNRGRIKRLARITVRNDGVKIKYKEKILKQYDRNGYKRIVIIIREFKKSFSVHKLVLEAFVPNPFNKPESNHIDGDKGNNRVENLEWCTPSENIQHAYKTGLSKNTHKKKPVTMLNLQGKTLKRFNSITEAGVITGVKKSAIGSCCNNRKKYKTAGGYKWKFTKK